MKVLAIASKGGHWIQLCRITSALNTDEIIYVSTRSDLQHTVEPRQFFLISDGNRWAVFTLINSFFSMLRIIRRHKPTIIITTGSAPGLMGIIAGKLYGVKSAWIDSIANVNKLSLSGRIALLFADRVYTQWQHLSTTKIIFHGNIFP